MSDAIKTTYHVIGLMSGSSLDGLDMALCRFNLDPQGNGSLRDWSILEARTAPYDQGWRERLRRLPGQSGRELMQAHADFGRYMGALLLPFLEGLPTPPDLIASHGHTVFHYPERQMTAQIGDGAVLAAVTGHLVAAHFRDLDVALGGQGAPLAPLADRFLFPGFDFYLNLGGIANISARTGDDRFIAFDITGANQVLDELAGTLGLPYDEGGKIAASGKLLEHLLQAADDLDYFERPYPKSLGNDWVQESLLTVFQQAQAPAADKLHTACIHLARQTGNAISRIVETENLDKTTYRMLVSGGGAFNRFLMDSICLACKKVCPLTVTVPDATVIAFKEAALIGLMGLLRLLEKPNCMASVTGASRDAVGGALHYGRQA